MQKMDYTEPAVWDRKGNIKHEWCVGFYVTDPTTGVKKAKQVRRDINRLHTKAQRYEYGKTLAGIVSDALANGWNPFIKDFETFIVEHIHTAAELAASTANTPKMGGQDVDISNLSYSDMPFNEAIEFAFSRNVDGLAESSVKAYRIIKDFILISAARVGSKVKLSEFPVSKVERAHIRLLLDQMEKDRKEAYKRDYEDKVAREAERVRTSQKTYKARTFKQLKFTGNTYNKYRDTLFTFFSVLEEFDAVKYNPCGKISARPQIDTDKHRHATTIEEQRIKQYLREKHIRLYVFTAIVELAGLRPNEILSLRICDIDKLNQSFVLWEGEAKTRTKRLVPIPNTLLPLLALLNLEKHVVKTDFMFSEALLPGPRRIKRDKVTKVWDKLVHRDLEIDVTLYSFKGLGADKKRDAGIQKSVVSKNSLGHTKEATTDIYLEREEERNRRHIIEDTPAFDIAVA